MRGRIWILWSLVAIGTALVGTRGRAEQAGPIFTVFSNRPVVMHGAPGAWDDRYTDPGAVFYTNGQFQMLRNGFRNWPAAVQWGYVSSPDGYTWTKQSDQPVFTTAQVPYAGVAALASSGLVLDDGTWVIYFQTYGDGPGASWAIGRATAPGPTGPWVPHAAPVVRPGPAGAWDDRQVTAPSVVRTETGYVMYYEGVGQSGVGMIGQASSPDGLHWTKYDDPATTDSARVASDPVFVPGEPGTWDSPEGIGVQRPRVQHTPDGWVMLYRGGVGPPANLALGYALSADGIHWVRSENNPVLRARDIPGGTGIYFSNLVYHEGTYFVFWEVTRGTTNDVSDIYLATHQGPLPTSRVLPLPTTTPSPVPPSPGRPTPAVLPTIAVPGERRRTFAETGQTVQGLFLDYWEAHGGLPQQGYPISGRLGEVSTLDGQPYTVQYFERAVFEYHPEHAGTPFAVLLTQLGTYQYRAKYGTAGAPDQRISTDNPRFFPETGHTLGGKFRTYWETHGALAQQGYPISEEFQEASVLDPGQTYTVQYFERAVFEAHPENAPPYDVLLAQLGTFQYQQNHPLP
jgi:hypothetical protein